MCFALALRFLRLVTAQEESGPFWFLGNFLVISDLHLGMYSATHKVTEEDQDALAEYSLVFFDDAAAERRSPSAVVLPRQRRPLR